jgi:proline iminopeptidase
VLAWAGQPDLRFASQDKTAMDGYLTTDDGVRLFYQQVGAGVPTVIVPNGLYLVNEFSRLIRGRTFLFYDVRNRGRSDPVTDPALLARGILQDVDDLDAVRRHFGIARGDLIGHSYIGLMAALYAINHPAHVGRVIQIGPMQPVAAKQYSPPLASGDGTVGRVMAKLAELQRSQQPGDDPEEMCRRFWSVLRLIYVTNPADADRIDWGRCELPNERTFLRYFNGHIVPSIQRLELTKEAAARASMPVLTIHGTADRSAPYGGGRDWVALLPNARLLSVPGAGHAPWIEAPEPVLGAMDAFLSGAWPAAAEQVI